MLWKFFWVILGEDTLQIFKEIVLKRKSSVSQQVEKSFCVFSPSRNPLGILKEFLRNPKGIPKETLRNPSGIPKESLEGIPKESLRNPEGLPKEFLRNP